MGARKTIFAVLGATLVLLLVACGSDTNSQQDGDSESKTSTNSQSETPSDGQAEVAQASDGYLLDPDTLIPSPISVYPDGQPTPTPNAESVCSYADPSRLVFQEFEEYRGELHACSSEFAWPEGYGIDPEKLAFGFAGGTGGQEQGLARVTTWQLNACAWMTAWSDYTQSDSAGAADQALNYMDKALPYLLVEGPPSPENASPIITDAVDRAKLGDPTIIMTQWVNGFNCAHYPEFRIND